MSKETKKTRYFCLIAGSIILICGILLFSYLTFCFITKESVSIFLTILAFVLSGIIIGVSIQLFIYYGFLKGVDYTIEEKTKC